MHFLGIDPGFTGAIACLNGGTRKLAVMDMPVLMVRTGKTEIDHVALFELLRPPSEERILAFLEVVHSMPKQGLSSTFRFGQGYGAIQMALLAHHIPTKDTTPQKWKKHFGIKRTKDMTDSNYKRMSCGLATQQFPANADDFKRLKDNGRAEAALIALYGYETQPQQT